MKSSSSGSGPAGKNSSFGHIISKSCLAWVVAVSKSNDRSGSLVTIILLGSKEESKDVSRYLCR